MDQNELNQIINFEEDDECDDEIKKDAEEIRKGLLSNQNLFSDFKKKGKDDLQITFKVGFGEETANL